eukprot:3850024-Pyramimonas_sp.AAC.1
MNTPEYCVLGWNAHYSSAEKTPGFAEGVKLALGGEAPEVCHALRAYSTLAKQSWGLFWGSVNAARFGLPAILNSIRTTLNIAHPILFKSTIHKLIGSTIVNLASELAALKIGPPPKLPKAGARNVLVCQPRTPHVRRCNSSAHSQSTKRGAPCYVIRNQNTDADLAVGSFGPTKALD